MFHPKNWFDPEYTKDVEESYTVKVEEKITFISREKLVNQMVAPIRTKLYEERTRILTFADGETESVMQYFEDRFDEVDDILAKKASELRMATSSKIESEKALNEATNLLNKLVEIKDELNSILDI